MTEELPVGILRWAQRPGARRLLAAARDKVEAGIGRRGSLGDLNAAERRDVRELLGVLWDASDRGATLGALRDALDRHGVRLEDLLIHLEGPLRDRPRERTELAKSQADDTQSALEALTRALPHVPEAIEDEVRAVLIRRCLPPAGAGARQTRATELVALLAGLPGPGIDAAPLLAVVAARCFGDAHALDQSRPLGRSAARLAALLGAIGDVDPADPRPTVEELTSQHP